MSRYIDADALMDSIIEKWGINPKYLDDSLDAMKDVQTLEWISSAPSIDIVRCGECKYFIDNLTEDDTDEVYGECCFDWDIKMPKADDFCSYGEHKESE